MSFNKDTGMYEGYIYLITNKVNGKGYIGQTSKTVEHRWKQHIYDSHKVKIDTYFHQAMKNYGDNNFEIKELLCVSNDTQDGLIEMLNEIEIEYISKYQTLRPNGYNTAIGGNVLPNTFTQVKVYQFDMIGNFITEYESMADASQKTNTQQSDISKCCYGVIKSANNFIWSLTKDVDMSIRRGVAPIDVYYSDGTFIETTTTMKECKKYASLSSVDKICNGKGTQIHGYVFRYHGNSFNKYDTERKHLCPIDVYDLNANLLVSLDNAQLVVDYLWENYQIEATRQGIWSAIKGESLTSYNFVFRRKGESFDKYKLPDIRTRMVNQYDLENNYLNTFNSITDATNSIGKAKTTTNICAMLKGKQATAYGYKWYYADDSNQPDKTKIIDAKGVTKIA